MALLSDRLVRFELELNNSVFKTVQPAPSPTVNAEGFYLERSGTEDEVTLWAACRSLDLLPLSFDQSEVPVMTSSGGQQGGI